MRKIIEGEGPKTAKIVLIGEAPGEEEHEQGRPFVGKSGKLLNELLEKAGVSREEVYITNLVKFKPPNNRNPLESEVKEFGPKLIQEIAEIKPKIIVTLGSYPTQYMLDTNERITKIRGKIHAGERSLLIPTFHPSYILRNPSKKHIILEDLKKAIGIINGR